MQNEKSACVEPDLQHKAAYALRKSEFHNHVRDLPNTSLSISTLANGI